jgi:Mitochondrial mRNA-processing protein COX24, C-terminal
MGSVIKKRRKKMSKHKYRKRVKANRHKQRK